MRFAGVEELQSQRDVEAEMPIHKGSPRGGGEFVASHLQISKGAVGHAGVGADQVVVQDAFAALHYEGLHATLQGQHAVPLRVDLQQGHHVQKLLTIICARAESSESPIADQVST